MPKIFVEDEAKSWKYGNRAKQQPKPKKKTLKIGKSSISINEKLLFTSKR